MASDSWDTYLSSWSSANPLINVRNIRARITDKRKVKRLFSKEGKVNVRVTGVDSLAGNASSTLYDNEQTLSAAVDAGFPSKANIIIVSIYSEDSISPLGITSTLMHKLCSKFQVHPDFLRVVLAFGEAIHVAEASSSNPAINFDQRNNSIYISYLVNYVEENFRKEALSPWSWRHTGIYHHHTKEHDLIIILHPNPESVLETRILEWLRLNPSLTIDTSSSLTIQPDDSFLVHPLALTSFVDNWRWYFRYIGDEFNYENDQAMTTKPEKAKASESFDRVERLRGIADFILQANACCKSNLGVVAKLNKCSIPKLQDDPELGSLEASLNGFIESLDALMLRIRNTIDLVGYTLTLHNQLEAAKTDKELRDLTEQLAEVTNDLKRLQQDSVDDSATVKIITLVSAVYLPGSFIASLYGMNFFVFNNVSDGIHIARDFWVFIATWIPATMVTGLAYLAILWFDSWWKHRKFEPFKRPPKPLLDDGERPVKERHEISEKIE